MPTRIVAKVGGSLYDWPELRSRLLDWIESRQPADILLVPGGGTTADVVRSFDSRHRLGEERSHWLALRAVSLNAHFLVELLPNASLVSSRAELFDAWAGGRIGVLDAFAFAEEDEHLDPAHALPHSWDATTDSLAVRAARWCSADELVLLKSVGIPENLDWKRLAESGYVDPLFPSSIEDTDFRISAVDLRRRHPAR